MGLQCVKLLATNILDFVYVLSKSFFSAVIHLNMTFKYISGRVTIIPRNKKKLCPEGVRHEKKSISKTPCRLN
jgi:hypothetical protein